MQIAQGPVWTGADALSRGLIDQLGGLSDAIKLAKLEAGFSEEVGCLRCDHFCINTKTCPRLHMDRQQCLSILHEDAHALYERQ